MTATIKRKRSALLEPLGSVNGLAYADGGRRVEVLVMRKRDPGER